MLGLGSFRTACEPHRFLPATTSLNYGREFPTTETPGRYSPLVKCCNRGHESRQGGLERNTSQGRLWLCPDYVELGLACAEVCKALNRGMNGKNLDDLSQPVQEAIAQLAT